MNRSMEVGSKKIGVDFNQMKSEQKDYGKSVVVTEEDFEKAINKNWKPKDKETELALAKQPQGPVVLSEDDKERLRQCFNEFGTVKTIKRPPRSRLNANGVREVMHLGPEVTATMTE